METPLVLTLFNQPEATQRVFDAIRAAQPSKLFLISDAGRTLEEASLVSESRRIVEAVDWPCEVFKNYAETNMGAKARLSSGITWVFEHVDRAIILEHDCLPDSTFFPFCEELLEKYKDDERIMHIGGTNFQAGNKKLHVGDSYYFSLVPQIWGFATWARAWQHYDVNIKSWPEVREQKRLKEVFKDPATLERWTHRFDEYYQGIAKSWDGQWAFACLVNHGLSIVPSVNLVSNIGFNSAALTTKDAGSALANMPTYSMQFPLVHPTAIAPNEIADAYTAIHIFDVNRTWGQKIRWFFRSRFPGPYRALKSLLKTSS